MARLEQLSGNHATCSITEFSNWMKVNLFKPHDSHPRNRLIANAFYMAGFVEAWGRGFELISEAFREQGLEVPTLVEEQGGVRVIIKRELFYGIQQGGRIDPKTGRLIKADDTKNVIENV